jgi:hypothetical protein
MYEPHFYEDSWKELDRLIEAAQRNRKEGNMRINARVYGRNTFT